MDIRPVAMWKVLLFINSPFPLNTALWVNLVVDCMLMASLWLNIVLVVTVMA